MRRAVLLLAFLPLPALAQEASPPDLVGTWTGTFQAVLVGATPDRANEGPGPQFADTEMTYTLEITEQQGARVVGTMGGERTEALIGGLMPPDFASGVLLDDEGRFTVSVRDAATMDICYDHRLPDGRIVACGTFIKQ